ncbi:MAG: Lpp/OprI family alanine-zipper lipoprotein [Pseudomonadota bacterium]|nr:Lpp/OprI family alanine-zipper lipoprotein [Pseudomonadota bacterium]
MKLIKYATIAVVPILFAAGCETTATTQSKIDQANSSANEAKAAAIKASSAAQAAAAAARAAADAANRAAAEAKAAGDKADRIFQKNLRK